MSLALRHITHSYTNVPVVTDITFTIERGTIHTLLGMNGAGKSTILRMLAGDFSPLSGAIHLDNKEVSFQSPRQAHEKGIAFVAQEVDYALMSELSVLENVLLNQIVREKRIYFSKKAKEQEAARLLKRVGLNLNVKQPISQCSLYEKQLILIARALSDDVQFLLLDEPTSALGPKEAQHLLELIHSLKKQGVGILLVSHRLSEIRQLADKMTLLRNGQVVCTASPATMTDKDIVTAIAGEVKPAKRLEKDLTTAENLFEHHALHVKKGEVVVIYGLLGSGKSDVAETLFGAREPVQVTINGTKQRFRNPSDAIRAGIALVPEERRKQGLFVSESISNHLSLHRKGRLHVKSEEEHALKISEQFNIQPRNVHFQVGRLSGGNQQKVSIAKWAGFHSKVFILDEPTKGIDMAAKQDVFRFISDATQKGAGVLYFTAEQDEALQIADRILIMCKGEIITEVLPRETDAAELLRLAEGGEIIDSIHSNQTV
ncbi:sugar ABC transporter ATP-binding protein [Ectobacillus sp. JY-23]|nr:sugar ABC transporter ATP-binding protein [Ectobacillus sp. JY-23]UOY91981.1 sugar ABC transporter ATP-binding protein [Ectobacillus sp. JY-23]